MRTLLILCLLSTALSGATINVPAAHSTIQGAIDAANDNDLVLVASGTYMENIDFKGKAITVRSENGPEVTTIDGNQAGAVVVFKSNESLNSVLHGFTITNGSGYYFDDEYMGGGIYCRVSSPEISNNIITRNITDNTSHSLGGGVYCDEASAPLILNNRISENKANAGPGIFAVDAWPIICNNIIHNNQVHFFSFASHAVFFENCFSVCENTLIFKNEAGGLACTESKIGMAGCTVVENSTVYSAYGVSCWEESELKIYDSIIRDNRNGEIEIGFTDNPSTLSIRYSNLKGGAGAVNVDPGCVLNWGSGMMDADPEFVTGAEGDYYLSQIAAGQAIDSPCLNMGSDSSLSRLMDVFTTRTDELPDNGQVDMGYHYTGTRLRCDHWALAANTGGNVNFYLNAGAGNANRDYLVLSSITGAIPGSPLPGGQILPINWDLFTNLIIPLLNTPVFQKFLDKLDGQGKAKATFSTPGPLPSSIGGFTLYFAYTLDTYFTSNPVALKILAEEVWVDDNYGPSTPGWGLTAFDSVQDGLDAVSDGGKVHVKNGTYDENIWVYRSVQLLGEDKNNTIIKGETYRPVVRISAPDVEVSNIQVKTGPWVGEVFGGLWVLSENCTIKDSVFTDNGYGVVLFSAKNATIINNTFLNEGMAISAETVDGWNSHTITNNTANSLPIMYYKDATGITVPSNVGQVILANCANFTVDGQVFANIAHGVQLGFCTGCLVSNNSFSAGHGVWLDYSDNNWIYKNSIVNSYGDSIQLYQSDLNKIEENTISLVFDDAIDLEYSNHNLIFNNTVTQADGAGMVIDESTDNVIYTNTFQDNETGIELESKTNSNDIYDNDFLDNEEGLVLEYNCQNNEIYLNTFQDNDIGLNLEWCYSNTIYNNNFINNSFFNALESGINTWFKPYPVGGNYWDDHPGTLDAFSGALQNIPGSDNFFDLGLPNGGLDPHFISGSGSKDDYPSVVQF